MGEAEGPHRTLGLRGSHPGERSGGLAPGRHNQGKAILPCQGLAGRWLCPWPGPGVPFSETPKDRGRARRREPLSGAQPPSVTSPRMGAKGPIHGVPERLPPRARPSRSSSSDRLSLSPSPACAAHTHLALRRSAGAPPAGQSSPTLPPRRRDCLRCPREVTVTPVTPDLFIVSRWVLIASALPSFHPTQLPRRLVFSLVVLFFF